MPNKTILIESLKRLLAGTLLLRCKARFFAWSLPLDDYDGVRALFYEDYAFLDKLCDEFAVTLRRAGGQVPGAYSILSPLSSVKEDPKLPVEEMAERLARDHEQLLSDTQFAAVLSEEEINPDARNLLLTTIGRHESIAAELRTTSTNSCD